MKKVETLFIGGALVAVIAIATGAFWYEHYSANAGKNHTYPESKYGAFLAAQHAIYVNDFENASKYSAKLTDTDYPIVQSTKFLSDFLSGKLPDEVVVLE